MKFNKQMAMLGLGIIASTNVLAQTFYQCMPCPAGSYASGGKCVSCPTTEKVYKQCQGTWFCMFSFSEASCKSRPGCTPIYETRQANYVVNAEKTGCVRCPDGTILDKAISACMPCPAGTYANKGKCESCPAGSYSTITGAKSKSSCIKCPKNQCSKPGSTFCGKPRIKITYTAYKDGGMGGYIDGTSKWFDIGEMVYCDNDTFGDVAYGYIKGCSIDYDKYWLQDANENRASVYIKLYSNNGNGVYVYKNSYYSDYGDFLGAKGTITFDFNTGITTLQNNNGTSVKTTNYENMDYAIFAMTIHPDVSGRPQVLLMHQRIIEHINKHEGVRWVTLNEMADDFIKRCPRKK